MKDVGGDKVMSISDLNILLFLLSLILWVIMGMITLHFQNKGEKKNNYLYINYANVTHFLSIVFYAFLSMFFLITLPNVFGIALTSFSIFMFCLISYTFYLSFKYGFNTETKTYQFSKPYINSQIKKLFTEKKIEFKKLEENKLYIPSKSVTFTLTGMTKRFTHVIIGDYIGPNKDWIDSLVNEMDRIFKEDENTTSLKEASL